MYILDTNVLILAIKGETKCSSLLNKILKKEPISISVISLAEFLVKPDKEEKEKFETLIKDSKILDINEEIARHAAIYRKKYLRISRVKLLDYLIAAQAKINNLTLVTNNTEDFPMKDIKIIKP